MAISYSEYTRLTCPGCGAGFEADVWTLVDAAERSDLANALRDGALNVVVCPKCGHQGPAGAPLLFHDPSSRRVYFAVPPGVAEHAWRERAQELLYLLVGGLREEERRPYLGDVQIEQEIEGVRRAVLRRERGRRSTEGTGGQRDKETRRQGEDVESHQPVTPSPAPPFSLSREDATPIVEAVRALLAADNDAEFDEIVAANPLLLDAEADAVARQLADLAYEEGDRDVAMALRELRVALARMRSGADQRPLRRSLPLSEAKGSGQATTNDQRPTTESEPETQSSEFRTQNLKLSDAAYQALLHVASPEELRAAARDYPALLEEGADAALATRTEAALDEGNERLARTIEAHREALAELRDQANGPDLLLQAVHALLDADGEAAVADVISSYPMLLTDAAQDALFGLAAGARARGDEDLAEYANSRRALLHTVRVGLEEH